MKRPAVFVITFAVLAVAAALIFWFFAAKRDSQAPPPAKDAPSPSSSTRPTSSARLVIDAPRGKVEVKDFLSEALDRNESSVLIRQRPDFQVTYFFADSSFLITILKAPVLIARDRAEREFVELLDVSLGEACKLTVWISVPRGVDPDWAGQQYPLTFCYLFNR